MLTKYSGDFRVGVSAVREDCMSPSEPENPRFFILDKEKIMEKIGAVLEREVPETRVEIGRIEGKKEREGNLEMVGFSPMSRKGYTLIPNYLLDLKISVTAKVVYSILLSYCWNKDFCFPAGKEIAEKVGITAPRLSRYFKELEEAGLIRTIRTGRMNKYILYATAKNHKK